MKFDNSKITVNFALIAITLIVGLSLFGCNEDDKQLFGLSPNDMNDYILDEYLDVKHYCFGKMDEDELKIFYKAKERIELSLNPQGYYDTSSMNSNKFNMSDSLFICILNMYKKTNRLL